MSNLPVQPTTNKPSLVRHTSPTNGELVSLCLGEITTLGQAKDYSFRNSVRDWQIPVGSEATLIYKQASLEHLTEVMRICYYFSESTPFTEKHLAFLNSEIDSNQRSYDDLSARLQMTAMDLVKVCAERRASSEKVQVDKDQYHKEVMLLESALFLDRYSEYSEIVSQVLNGGSILYLVQLEVVGAQKGRGLAKQLLDSFHQVSSEMGIDKTYSIVDKRNTFKPAMDHLFKNSGYRGTDSCWDRELSADPFTLYLRGLNHIRKWTLCDE